MPQPVKLIIDTDPGIDDAMAIYYAAGAPEIELLGLTTVHGNVPVSEATRNALHLLERLGLDLPVAEGAEGPLEGPTRQPPRHIHGDAGLGYWPAPEVTALPVAESAAMFLTRMAAEAPGEVTICAIGPLTNIAAALRLDPQFASNVAQIVVMGGAIDTAGNATPHAEANIFHDPLAAAEVLASPAPVALIGLDVTHRVLGAPSEFSTLTRRSLVAGAQLQDLTRFYQEFHRSRGILDGCYLHDPVAVIACAWPELFSFTQSLIRVEQEGETRGKTVADSYADQPRAFFADKVDTAAVKDVFFKALARLP